MESQEANRESIVDKLKRHWIIGVIMIASVCVSATWFSLTELFVKPRDYTINQQQRSIDLLLKEKDGLQTEKSILERKVDELKGHNFEISPIVWEGSWLTSYSNGFSHRIYFIITDTQISGTTSLVRQVGK